MRKLTLAIALFSLAAAAGAQQNPIIYSPASCWLGGEMAALPLQVSAEGDLRAFFRHVGTVDWCSVEGVNRGPLSNVTMPKFINGDEIEYFFVVAQGKRVVAKSEQIYRVKITDGCETPYARHTIMLVVNCTPNGSGQIGSSIASGFAVTSTSPKPASPSNPNGQ